MKGFIVASVNPKLIKQSAGLEEQMIRYTSVMCDDVKEIPEQFNKHFPNHTILLTISAATMKKNLQLLEQLAQAQNIALEA
jgi:hypothetical protein